MTTITINKWGNSLGIRLPKYIVDTLGIKAESELEYSIKGETIILKKCQDKKITLADILARHDELAALGITPHELVEIEDVGDEILEEYEWK